MNRRALIRSLVRAVASTSATVLLSTTWLTTRRCQAQTRRPKRFANLREQLEFGLKARRPQEFRFIARVVKLVEDGKLPLDVVLAAFDWARDKLPYPFPYFVRAMQILAARRGIKI